MQKINGNVTDLGLEAKETPLTFTIVNRFLKPITLQDTTTKQTPTLETTITTGSDGNFNLELWENDAGERLSFYLITSSSYPKLSKYIFIPFSSKESLHFQCLREVGGCGDLINTIVENNRLYDFSDDFLEVIDEFMLDDSIFLSRTRERIFNNFCNYADEIDPTKQCDALLALDIKLGEIVDQYGDKK